jgi:hypothetical protein
VTFIKLVSRGKRGILQKIIFFASKNNKFITYFVENYLISDKLHSDSEYDDNFVSDEDTATL